MGYYLEVLSEYVQFEGRVRRKKFWIFSLINSVIAYITAFVFLPLSMLYSLAVFLPALGVTIRRLHDTDRSGWWWLISAIPVIGHFILLIFLVQDSTPGTNQYGPNPKEELAIEGDYQQQSIDSTENRATWLEERTADSQLKCQDCGEIVDLNTRFCANCGAKIVPDEQLRCDNCNTALEEGTNFCPECGTDIS